MKTLKEHNDRARIKIRSQHTPLEAAGIKCDKCNNQMSYSNNYILCAIPPIRNVHCEKCGYKATKVGG